MASLTSGSSIRSAVTNSSSVASRRVGVELDPVDLAREPDHGRIALAAHRFDDAPYRFEERGQVGLGAHQQRRTRGGIEAGELEQVDLGHGQFCLALRNRSRPTRRSSRKIATAASTT